MVFEWMFVLNYKGDGAFCEINGLEIKCAVRNRFRRWCDKEMVIVFGGNDEMWGR